MGRSSPLYYGRFKIVLSLPGGIYTPSDCEPRQRLAIIIPFRNREPQLQTLLRHLHPFLQRQKRAYRVFVVEQVVYRHSFPPLISRDLGSNADRERYIQQGFNHEHRIRSSVKNIVGRLRLFHLSRR